MKILAFTDIHGDLFALEEVRNKAKSADLAICLGDLSYFEHDIEFLLEILNEFPVPVILLHGNHEMKENLDFFCSYLANIEFVHQNVVKKKGFNFIVYGGDGFSKVDSEFEKWGKSLENELKFESSILLLHGPPFNTNLDVPFENTHSGNKSIRKFIEKTQPLLVLCGHIHENEGNEDWIGKTYIFNPGPFGTLIDLDYLKTLRINQDKKN